MQFRPGVDLHCMSFDLLYLICVLDPFMKYRSVSSPRYQHCGVGIQISTWSYFIWRFPHVFNNPLLLIVKETIKLTPIPDAKTSIFYSSYETRIRVMFNVLQNSSKPTSGNPKILIIWLFVQVFPRPSILLFAWKKSIMNETGRSQGHVQGRLFRVSVHPSFWFLLATCLVLHLLQLWRLQSTQKKTLITLKEITKWNTSLINRTGQV